MTLMGDESDDPAAGTIRHPKGRRSLAAPDATPGHRPGRSDDDTAAAPVAYEVDPYGWALQQAASLRAGRTRELDLVNLAQTLDGLVEQERGKLQAAIEQILACLIRWDRMTDARSRSWALTIHQQRRRILRQLRRQPGLRSVAADLTAAAYGSVRADVTKALDLYDDALPRLCPYGWEDLMSRDIEWV